VFWGLWVFLCSRGYLAGRRESWLSIGIYIRMAHLCSFAQPLRLMSKPRAMYQVLKQILRWNGHLEQPSASHPCMTGVLAL
jgi:hypothetical protein